MREVPLQLVLSLARPLQVAAQRGRLRLARRPTRPTRLVLTLATETVNILLE